MDNKIPLRIFIAV